MPTTINVKTLRREMGRIIERVSNGEQFTVLHRSRFAFRIVPIHDAVLVGSPEDDSLFGAEAVGASNDGFAAWDHDRILYGEASK